MAPLGELKGWRDAMRHGAFRAWADEALGDRRQVYARRVTGAPGDGLVYMPDGDALAMRAAAQAGDLVCPVPGCPSHS